MRFFAGSGAGGGFLVFAFLLARRGVLFPENDRQRQNGADGEYHDHGNEILFIDIELHWVFLS